MINSNMQKHVYNLAGAYIEILQGFNVFFSFCPVVACKSINKKSKIFIEFCFPNTMITLQTSFCTSLIWTSNIFFNRVCHNPCNLITPASLSDA